MASPPLIRVASVPSNHVYVRHLSALTGPDPVRRLSDPATGEASRWWPPVMLEPGWVREQRDDFDVFHLHFGFDAQRPEQLADLVGELRRAGKPLVYTVHDLRNPHHLSADLHLEQLDVLIPAADAVVTLTPGAAAVIGERWQREAVVLPHPHVVELAGISGFPRQRSRAGEPFVIGLHAKSLRASTDPRSVLEVLIDTVNDLSNCELTVNVHADVMTRSGANHSPDLAAFLERADDDGLLSLRVHEYLSDDDLWTYLRGLDLSVLAYRFGTHSGWLEACHDLGTTVLAPSCGFFAEQRPCLTYQHDETGLDAGSLDAAVRYAYNNRPLWQADSGQRRLERELLAEAHLHLYRNVLAQQPAPLSLR